MTADLNRRVWQHRNGHGSEFAAAHGCTLLVHAEPHATMPEAIAREKAIKRWNRDWKVRLIEEGNPDWLDLYDRLNW